MNKFVADKSQRTAAEPRQARNGHWLIACHHLFHHRQSVPHRPSAGGLRADGEALDGLPVFDKFDPCPSLLAHRARSAADERVAANMLAALDRFAEKGLALAANFLVGRERRFQIRQNAPSDRNQVALGGQPHEFILSRIIHGSYLTSRRRKRHKESEV